MDNTQFSYSNRDYYDNNQYQSQNQLNNNYPNQTQLANKTTYNYQNTTTKLTLDDIESSRLQKVTIKFKT